MTFGKKMLKDGGNKKTLKKVHVNVDNFDVRMPIASLVPQPHRERERERERDGNSALQSSVHPLATGRVT